MRRRVQRLLDAAQVVILVALVAAIFGVGVAAVDALWHSGLDGPTKLGATGDVLAAGAFVLALLAAVVAILAYRVSILKPDLRAEVRFGHGESGLVVHVMPPNEQGLRYIAGMHSQIHFHLHNYGPVSARNPALRVKLTGAMFGRQPEGWALGDHLHGLGGFASAQWDGGADYSIHPNWGRDLPTLVLGSVGMGVPSAAAVTAIEPQIFLEVVADGFSDSYQLSVVFKQIEH